MGAFMGYMTQIAIIMTILYLVYKLLMSSLAFHSFNRKIILGIYIVSWILPAFTDLIAQPNSMQVNMEVGNLELTSVITRDAEQVKGFNWLGVIAILYISGILIMTTVTLLSIWRMATIIRKGRLIEKRGEYSVKVSEEAPSPFSWGRYVIIRPEDIDEALDMVISHETNHLRKLHWIDLLLARITIIMQWFSPASWLLARELHEVHEYEVDEISADENFYEYQLMLIKKTVGSSFPDIADSLNHSQIKKRLTMMRKKSNPKRKAAALLLPLSACAAVLILTQPLVARVVDQLESVDLSSFTDNKINENERTLQIAEIPYNEDQDLTYSLSSKKLQSNDGGSISDSDQSPISSRQGEKMQSDNPDSKALDTPKQNEDAEESVQSVEKIAQFKGGEKEFLSFLIENIKYPECEIESQDNTVNVILSFNILADGSVDDIAVKRSGGEVFDNEAIEVVKKTSGKWIPAEYNGKPVASQFTIPITFKKKA